MKLIKKARRSTERKKRKKGEYKETEIGQRIPSRIKPGQENCSDSLHLQDPLRSKMNHQREKNEGGGRDAGGEKGREKR